MSSSSAPARGGGTLAYALAPSGKRVLLLERGDHVARERHNWNSRAAVNPALTIIANALRVGDHLLERLR